MTATAAKLSPKEIIQQELSRRVSANNNVAAKQTVETNPFADIATNSFYKVMFDPNLSEEQKSVEVSKLLTYASSKEEARNRIKEIERFEEYMQSVSEKMSTELIRLTNTDTFAELKNVYDQMNTSLLKFEEDIKPLTDILDGLYDLRQNGKTLDAFKEIQADRKNEVEFRKEAEIKKRLVDNIESQISRLESDNIALSQKKSFFGLGDVTQDAKNKIAQNKRDLEQSASNLDRISKELKDLEAKKNESSILGEEYAAQKKQLRELLDISSATHKERQEALVQSALDYVKTTKERVGNVRLHIGKIGTQLDSLADTNEKVTGVYAVIGQGVKGALNENQKVRDKFMAPAPGDEDNVIAEMKRGSNKSAVEEHISALSNVAQSTTSTYANLTSDAIRIKTMKDTNNEQESQARMMHTQGVAGIAGKLSVTLNAVSAAAIGEASSMAKMNMLAMNDSTNRITQKEALRVAMGQNEMSDDLQRAVEDLSGFKEILAAATNVSHAAMSDIKENMSKLESMVKDTRSTLQDNIAIAADVNKGGTTNKAEQVKVSDNPFKV